MLRECDYSQALLEQVYHVISVTSPLVMLCSYSIAF